jgi:hypothetical protein
MKLSHKEQQRFFDEGKTLVGEDGCKKKILGGHLGPMLGFGNPNGTWFYGACYFPVDEELILE